MANEPVFTVVSLYSLAGIALILAVAFAAQARFLAPNARGWDRFAFTWLVRSSSLYHDESTHARARSLTA